MLENSVLGKKSVYPETYQPDVLFAIPRKQHREKLAIKSSLPFSGHDFWNAYELSWLNAKGKPQIAYAQFIFPCESPKLVESKSLKLYLNSFNHTKFASLEAVATVLRRDLSLLTESDVNVNVSFEAPLLTSEFNGICLDDLDIECDIYLPHQDYLSTEDEEVNELLYSNLLKSNCPITGQPDWASIQIAYTGKKIRHDNLLKYIVSLRNHDEFHEHCVERIYIDIKKRCAPEKLCVYARYTRRGGIDINPYRANYPITIENNRLGRQ